MIRRKMLDSIGVMILVQTLVEGYEVVAKITIL